MVGPAASCDEDGWHQVRIDPSFMAKLNNEASDDVDAFARYAVSVGGHRDTLFCQREWLEIRAFIRAAAALNESVVCSY